MKFLADENVDRMIVEWLREGQHGVNWASETLASVVDPELFRVAQTESRILITGDLGFGELVYRQRIIPLGVISLRIRAPLQGTRLRIFQGHWPSVKDRLIGSFVVITDAKVRIRPLRRASIDLS